MMVNKAMTTFFIRILLDIFFPALFYDGGRTIIILLYNGGRAYERGLIYNSEQNFRDHRPRCFGTSAVSPSTPGKAGKLDVACHCKAVKIDAKILKTLFVIL